MAFECYLVPPWNVLYHYHTHAISQDGGLCHDPPLSKFLLQCIHNCSRIEGVKVHGSLKKGHFSRVW